MTRSRIPHRQECARTAWPVPGGRARCLTTIAGVNVAGLTGLPAGSDVTEAFDQPLNRVQVTAIVQPFFKPTIPAS